MVKTRKRHSKPYWRRKADEALKTHRKSINTIMKTLRRDGWHSIPFVKNMKKKHPMQGAVDLVAIRPTYTKVKKRLDKLQIVFFNMKSGSALEPTKEDRRRLRQSIRIIEIGYDYARIDKNKVYLDWNPDEYLSKIELK